MRIGENRGGPHGIEPRLRVAVLSRRVLKCLARFGREDNDHMNSAPRFSRRTILSAVDLLNRLTQAELTRFVLDLGPDVAAEVGQSGSVMTRLNKLIWYLDVFPNYQVEDGRSIQEVIIEKAIWLLAEQEEENLPLPNEAAFLRRLEQDGFAVKDSQLRRTMPMELQLPEAESEVERLLSKYGLAIARGHLDQARDAHARGEWAAANAQIRTYLEAMLDAIAELIDPSSVSLAGGHQRRERLAQKGFLSATLNEWDNTGKGYINGLMKRLHPQGSHPGLSDQEDSTFRLHTALLTARLLLKRLDGGSWK